MRRSTLVVLTILTLPPFLTNGSLRAQGQNTAPSQASLVEAVQPSLVTVTAYDAAGKIITSGAGCFVRDRVIATDYLTIKDAASIKISTSRAESITGWLFAVDQGRLLALIHPDGTTAPALLPEESPGVGPSSKSSIAAGQQGLAVAGIRAGRADLLPVTISRPSDSAKDQYLAIDSRGQQSPSGSPIIDSGGRIAGIVTTVENAGAGYSYAVPARTLSKLIYQAVNDVASRTEELALEESEESAAASSSPTRSEHFAVPPRSTKGDVAKGEAIEANQGKVIRRVEPNYPALAKAARIAGSVVVGITINEAGYVISAHAFPLQSDPWLRGAAVAAAMGWRFAPTTLKGVPVKVIGTLTFNFELGKELPAPGGQEPAEIAKHLQAVKADPRSEDAVLKLGRAYFVKDMFQDAVRQFGTAVTLAPDDPVAFYELGSAYMALKDYADAIESLGQAVVLKPDYLEALGVLAFAYNTTEHYEEAVSVCEQALHFQNRNADAYHGLGWAYGGLHRFQDAIDAYRTEVEIRPYYAGAHYGLGVMYASVHDFTGAAQELQQALAINPYLTIAHSHLGMVYVATGDRASAQKELAVLRPLDAAAAAQLEEAIKTLPPD